MGSLLDLSCRRPTFSYDPEIYSQRLGQSCDVCNNSLTHEKCLSLCRCYVFCHQPCFLSKFEPTLISQDCDVKCQVCKETLQMDLEANYTYAPQKTTTKIINLSISILFLFLCIIAIFLTLNSDMTSQISFFLLYLEGLGLGIGIYILAMKVREFLYKKTIKVKEVISTKLEIQTSAFKELDIDTNEQLTKDYLTFESKKEKCDV